MIGFYCREFRLKHKATLKDVGKTDNIKSLSAFEMGRSTNISHFFKYVGLAIKVNDVEGFFSGVEKGVRNGTL